MTKTQDFAKEKRSSRKTDVVITAPSHALIEAIYRYQLVTCEQLRLACGYSKNSLRLVQKLLKALTAYGYVLTLSRPTLRGKAPFIYTLARKGLQYLNAAGYDVLDYFRPSQEREKENNYLFLTHTLALNDVLISASRLAQFTSNHSLFEFTHERVLKRTPYKVEVSRNDKIETITLIPDAFLEFRRTKATGKEVRLPVLYEEDLATTEQKRFRKKIRAYISLIKSGAYKEMFGTKTITIAFGTPKGEKRRDQMRDWTRKECAATSEPKWITELFLFTAHPQGIDPNTLWLTPVWYIPFDDKTPLALLPE